MTQTWEVYPFRYASMPERYEDQLFLGGDPKINWGMDYFFWALRIDLPPPKPLGI